ncbi:MAG: nitroreductase family protein [Thermodesulfobacteriota bacterium]
MRIERIKDRCNNCMLCVRECIAGVWREVNGAPEPVFPQACNLCSHCVAVCPRQAITHSRLATDPAARVQRKLLDADVYKEIAVTRRSIRQYRDLAVPRDQIEKIIDLARFSPTASNSQHVSYIVITDRRVIGQAAGHVFAMGVKAYRWAVSRPGKVVLGLLKRNRKIAALQRYMAAMDYYIEQSAAGRDYILHNAPVLILVCAPRGADFAIDNCNIAATNIINYAHTLGLGTCYIGFLTLLLRRGKKLRALLRVPEDRQVGVSLVMGYPAFRHSFGPVRKNPCVTWV